MNGKTVSRFFLGANSADGFYSLYDDFACAENGDFLWVIKGGPGCGKSSFMKYIGKTAQEAGLDVEYILCSGDPDSLDGVYIPALHTGYADGTAPHVLDPRYPAASGLYLDLGSFYDPAALEPMLPEISALDASYKALYTRAYASLAAAGAMDIRDHPGLAGSGELAAVLKRARGIANRELGREADGCGAVTRRFISSVTCKGRVFLEDTVTALCGRVYTLDNEYGMAHHFIEYMTREAVLRGHSVILCPEALNTDRYEALLIPELSLGFVAVEPKRGFSPKPYRHLRLDAMLDPVRIRSLRPKLRSMSRLRESLVDDAIDTLAQAKALHDQLEMLYNPYVDFNGLYAVAHEHADWLLRSLEDR